jgi:hypothetical protein
MSIHIEQAFVRNFEAEVHVQYQQMGSKLRNTVRTKDRVIGATTVFQKVGKGTASPKARHGKVPVMNVDHSTVECHLLDYYAGDWVDTLDELKTNINEQQVVAKAGAYALGRKTDEMIINELNKPGYIDVGDGATGMTLSKALSAFEALGDAGVPDDGQRYAIVGWKQWSALLKIPEFANADYVGKDDLPWKGSQAKRWLGTLWMPHGGLPKDGAIRRCFWYHKTAIGHAIGSEVRTDITWHGDRAAHFINNMMSQGAVRIDDTGVIALPCTEA